MKNFNASFALFAGLNLPAVSRLKKLWEALEKHKIWSKYTELKELYSPSGNHKNYQDALRNSEPPVIYFCFNYYFYFLFFIIFSFFIIFFYYLFFYFYFLFFIIFILF